MISEKNYKALLSTLHKDIHDSARSAAQAVMGKVGYSYYPMSEKFTPEQIAAFEKMRQIPGVQSALEAIITKASTSAIHTFLAYIDGIGDPDVFGSDWTGVALVDLDPASEYSSYLGELFYEYDEAWRENTSS